MYRSLALSLVLGVSSVGFAQSSLQVPQSAVKHYRVTFVIDSGSPQSAQQSFVLDVPVAAGKSGAARASLVSGSDGDATSIIEQTFQCTNVHPTATGLALTIAMESDREAPAIPGLISARHQHGEFQRAVDLEMGKPTVVTKEMHFKVLGNTDPQLAAKLKQPSPTITVTAEAL